ncbi:MAG: hypothetical protein NPIRA04_27170 [Nitrospirales bacterium]|nr:MAG: hypothetical protein NPIRA04_27170 [Nitrospirales bacterium]
MMELVQMLTNNLGVSEDQAKGGAGMLFNIAKEKLGSGEFQQIADAVPGIGNLMSAAPTTGDGGEGGAGVMGMLGGLASSLGGSAGGLGSLAVLAGGFSKLGLDTEMIGKFIPQVLQYVQSQGGDGVRSLLEKVISPSA